MKKNNVIRGVGMAAAALLAVSITAGNVCEIYRTQLDDFFGCRSSQIVTDKVEENAAADWNFKSNYKTAKDAIAGYKDFAIREAQESVALLKNNANALPISKTAKISLFGIRSYAPVYGNSAGSMADKTTVSQNQITKCFEDRGFQLNPTLKGIYEGIIGDMHLAAAGFGAAPFDYQELTKTDEVVEWTPSELAAINANYNKDYAAYSDAAIVVVGRPGGENKNYYAGKAGMKDGMETSTDNIMGLSSEERAIIAEAKQCSKKVIVLVNSLQVMEIKELKDDPDIDAVVWIGYPGAYGFYGVADVLNGTITPSAHLGDTYVTNGLSSPAMQNFGNIPWANVGEFTAQENVNSYLINAEGIYSGYRYYETRYADIVGGVAGAATAAAGTYTKDQKMATTAGTWDYNNEVVYPFGYGLSYTSFSQTLNSVKVAGNKKSAEVSVTVTNTGTQYSGKSVVQLYVQSPYTEYDKQNKVEKSAIQLLDFEKTTTLAPGDSQTITMNVDLTNMASYDYTTAKTYILDAGDYYFSIGDDAHDALNNVLAAQGKTGMKDALGNATNGSAIKTVKWTNNSFDDKTFSVSDNKTEITNQLTEGQFATDINAFIKNKVTYLTRSDWAGTFPRTITGMSSTEDSTGTLTKMLKNDFYDLKTNEDTSDIKWGQASDLNLIDLKGADWDDERWQELVDKMTISEFLAFAQNAFHKIYKIESVGYLGNNADDGPGGSDTHYFHEGTYQGEKYPDAADYEGQQVGTRVAPGQTNLAYTWNKELAYENGEIILGETSLILNLPIMIGPGGNLHRHGYNGRGGEYYSEDPMLSGYIGSATVQGAQSKGVLVNIKHAAFNDQEINRSGIAVFLNEQTARELELRNLQQMFEGKGKPASFYGDETKDDTYTVGAYGVMTSYNRIGAVASSANESVMVKIMRDEWGFKGYNVTDFTGVSLKAAPKESILYGTTAFCGFGVSVDYWTEDSFKNDRTMCLAIKQDMKYILYSLANSNALNGLNASSHTVELSTPWRVMYKTMIGVTAGLTALALGAYVALEVVKKVKGA